MPDVPVVDAHVHLWDPAQVRLPWVDGNTTLNQVYSVPQYREHSKPSSVQAFVYVETGAAPHFTLVEMRWAAERAAEEPKLKAIVAAAPLEHGLTLKSYLAELKRISPLIKGIRRITQGEKDAGIVLKPDFVAATQLLADEGFSCDLCFHHRQFEPHIELVRQCPKTAFIVDHIAKPSIREHLLEPWREHLKKLASFPNVTCKLSGMVTEADRENWQPADLAPYVAHVIESFGPDRVMFASDWPVCLLASSHERWVNTLDSLTRDQPAEARRKLWGENARRIYRF